MTTEELDAARAEHFKVVEAAPSTLILSKANIRPQAPPGVKCLDGVSKMGAPA